MRNLVLIAAISLAACQAATAPFPSSPAAVSDRTVLDEKLALGVEATYRGARTVAELAVDSGRLHGADAAEVARLDRIAFTAVQATRTAYRAGNADSYASAAATASLAVYQLLTIAKGDVH